MGEQTERALKNQQKTTDARIKKIVRSATVGFLILTIGLAASVYTQSSDSDKGRTQIVLSGRAVAVDGCNRDFTDRQVARSQTGRALVIIKHEHDLGNSTDREYRLGLDFYRKQLQSQALPDCRKAEAVLTDDPDAKVVVPEPLYPKRHP